MKTTSKFQWMATLVMGMAVTCVTMTSCTNEDTPADNPSEESSEEPSTSQVMMKELNKITKEDVGWVIGADGMAYSSVWFAIHYNTKAVASIVYVKYQETSNNYAFLAIAKDDESVDGIYGFSWDDAKALCEGKSPIKGCTWRLPSPKDWELMIFGDYKERGGKEVCDDFWTKSIYGTFEAPCENHYWTSDVQNPSAINIDQGRTARTVGFRYEGVEENQHMTADFGMGYWQVGKKYIVRAVLAYNM